MRPRFISLLLALLVFFALSSIVFAQGRTGAVCRDGTTSGATGRGACSHHGGVDHWITSEPEETPTFTPVPILAPTSTPTTTPKKSVTVPTTQPSPSVTEIVTGTDAIVLKAANLRNGPGTTYAIIGAATQGQHVTIIGQNDDGSWYHLASGEWIASFLVEIQTGDQVDAQSATQQVASQVSVKYDPAVKDYLNNMLTPMEKCADGSNIISIRFTESGEDISLVFTNKWRTQVAVALSEMQSCSAGIRKLQPPPSLSEIHQNLLTMANHVDRFVKLVTEGLDELNADKLTEAGNELATVGQISKTIGQKITALGL